MGSVSAERLCVCVFVLYCVDGRGNVAVAGRGPFHISQTRATLAKGIMQSPPLCVWEGTCARECERVFFFFWSLSLCESRQRHWQGIPHMTDSDQAIS